MESLLAGLRRRVEQPRARVRNVLGARNLRRQLAREREPRIVVGAGNVYEPGWIPTDIGYLNLLQPSDWQRFFRPASIAAILAEHVWEHLTREEGLRAARTCHQFLRPGGYLRLAIPDGHHPDPQYREWVRPGGSGPGADDHKVLYTHGTLSQLLKEAGFEVELLEYFDATGRFHHTEWDPTAGMIHRSRRYDERNRDGTLRYTSLIADARKKADRTSPVPV